MTTGFGTKTLALDVWRDVYTLTDVGRRFIANAIAARRWDDLRSPATAFNPQGPTGAPSFNSDQLTLDFGASGTDIIGVTQQLPHGWADTNVRPHIHWYQTAAGTVAWELQYRFTVPGQQRPAFTSINPIGEAYTYVSGEIQQITIFPEIDVSSIIGTTSTTMQFKILRNGNSDTLPVAAELIEYDTHIQFCDMGSIREYNDG